MHLQRLAFVLPFVAAACGQAFTPFNPGDAGGVGADLSGSGGGGGGGGGGDGGGMAVIDMAGFNMAGAPMIVITAPTAGAEVSGDALTVTATITSPTSTPILAGSTQITVTPPGGGVVTATMLLTSTPNVYKGTIDVSGFPSGNAGFTVSAADIAGLKASVSSTYVHDHGPILTFVQPMVAAVKGTVTVEIIVDDSLHPITMLSQVEAHIRTTGDVTLTQIAGALPFRVTSTVDLNSFTPPLDGPQIIFAKATNSKNTVGRAQRMFTVDNQGPSISITSPMAGAFVGGVIEIKATITDAVSGVDDATPLAVFGGDLSKSVALTRVDAMSFHGFFDVRSLGSNYVLPELSVRAKDTLGNQSELGEEIVVDNVKPWMTMNSAIQMRVSKPDSQLNHECSHTFSPLGPEAAHEGSTVPQIITLRSRIEDHGNWAPGLAFERISGLDPPTVTLFVIPDSAGAVLAVDTDNDGICDEMNPTLIPTTNITMSGEALALQMAPLSPGGLPDYRLDKTVTPPAFGGTCTPGPNCPPAFCDYVGDAATTNPPPPLCTLAGTALTFVIPWGDVVAPIWTLPPVTADAHGCVGYQLDSLNNSLPEGPTCVITRAVDKAGNANVSYPMHICLDRGGGKCAAFVPTPLDCTGKYDKVQQKIVLGTCAPAPVPAAGNNFHPNPGTFPTDGLEVRFIP
jgi:hypothetical protein